MRLPRFYILLAAVFLSAFACVQTARAQDASREIPVIGQKDIIKLISQAKGRVTLINFWATWCPPCRLEMPEFIRLRASYPESKLVMLGVSLDQDPLALSEFVRKHEINFPVFLALPDAPLAYGVRGIPKTLIYGPNGELVLNHDGYLQEDMLRELMVKLLGE